MSNKLKINFDKISIFNGFLYCQILFFKFCDCRLLLFNLFMDFVFMNPYKFIKKDFEIILNLFIFLYRYEDILDNRNFLYLLKNFLDLFILNKPKENNKTLALKKSNKILLFMLNLYFF